MGGNSYYKKHECPEKEQVVKRDSEYLENRI